MELVQEVAALFDRDLTRLEQELRAFTDTDALWVVAPGVSNAAGTLALHLEGNLREYIGRQLGHREYTRDRAREFSARAIPQQEILERVGELRGTIPPVIRELAPEALAEAYPEPYNGAAITTQQFLLHLLSHFNYHLGQIDYLRRFVTGAGAIQLATL
jgi:hypothetical protein